MKSNICVNSCIKKYVAIKIVRRRTNQTSSNESNVSLSLSLSLSLPLSSSISLSLCSPPYGRRDWGGRLQQRQDHSSDLPLGLCPSASPGSMILMSGAADAPAASSTPCALQTSHTVQTSTTDKDPLQNQYRRQALNSPGLVPIRPEFRTHFIA